jgi:hypothetical protein
MPLDRARAVSDVAQTIINSAKVDVEFIKVAKQIPESALTFFDKPALPSLGSSATAAQDKSPSDRASASESQINPARPVRPM